MYEDQQGKISTVHTFKSFKILEIKKRVPTLWAPVNRTDPGVLWQWFFPFRFAVWSTGWHGS